MGVSRKIVLKCYPDKDTVWAMLKEAPRILKRNEEMYRLEQMEECAKQLKEGNVKEAVSAARKAGYDCLGKAITLHFQEK